MNNYSLFNRDFFQNSFSINYADFLYYPRYLYATPVLSCSARCRDIQDSTLSPESPVFSCTTMSSSYSDPGYRIMTPDHSFSTAFRDDRAPMFSGSPVSPHATVPPPCSDSGCRMTISIHSYSSASQIAHIPTHFSGTQFSESRVEQVHYRMDDI